MVFIRQGDKANKKIYFTGAGSCMVTRQLNQKRDIYLGDISSGQMMGEKSAIFNSSSMVTLQSKSYCQIGTI